MIALEGLRRFETSYPRDLADVVERPYGLLYYSLRNPSSHDSNHAVLLDAAADPARAVADATRFYERHGLQPRVHPALCAGELERLRGPLEAAGYAWARLPWRLYVRAPAPQPTWPGAAQRQGAGLSIRRVGSLDAGIVALVHSDGPAPWTERALERHLRSESLHLLVGYLGRRPVTMASLKVGEGISRVDDVLTHVAYRGRGFASALVGYLVAYHDGLVANTLYLFAEHRVAVRIYERAGFREQPLDADLWVAWKPRGATPRCSVAYGSGRTRGARGDSRGGRVERLQAAGGQRKRLL